MKTTTMLALALLAATTRAEEAPLTPEPVTVFVTDKDGKQVDTEGMSATLTVTIKGAGTRTAVLAARKATDPSAKTPPAEHGGQIVTTADGLRVEFVPGWSPGKTPDAPCFEGTIALKAWACPMACVDPSDKAGKCSKCGMPFELLKVDFTASLTINGKDFEHVARGYAVPAPIPATYAEAAREAKDQSSRALKGSAALPRVRRIRRLLEGLAELASAGQKDDVRVKARVIWKACNEAEKSLVAGQNAAESLDLIDKKVSSLPAEGGGK